MITHSKPLKTKEPRRNEICWCPSGKKYKHCHLGRDKQTPISNSVIHNALNSFNTQKKCSTPSDLHSECTTKIIKAHSISKSSSLKEISSDGHVLAFAYKKSLSGPVLCTEKIGINKASTFSGFCSHHDKTLFAPIEDYNFESSPHHCFLVAYRGVCREVFSKVAASNILNLLKDLDKGKELTTQQNIQSQSKKLNTNNNVTTTDLHYIKSKLDLILSSKSYHLLNNLIIELQAPPPIMGSSIVAPTFDFNGISLQKFSSCQDDIPDYVAINAFSSNQKGYLVFSWLDEHSKSCSILAKQILEKQTNSNTLAAFMLALIENIYLSPIWWSQLNNKQQQQTKNLFSQGISKQTTGSSITSHTDLNFPKITSIITTDTQNPTLVDFEMKALNISRLSE